MQPVVRGIAGGLLLSLVVVAGVTLISASSSPGRFAQFEPTSAAQTTTTMSSATSSSSEQNGYVSALTTTTTVRVTSTVATNTSAPPQQAASQAGAINSLQSSVKSSTSALFTFLPVAGALVLGASVYLLSRNRIEREG